MWIYSSEECHLRVVRRISLMVFSDAVLRVPGLCLIITPWWLRRAQTLSYTIPLFSSIGVDVRHSEPQQTDFIQSLSEYPLNKDDNRNKVDQRIDK